MRGAIYVVDSGNRKIMGSKKVDATYTSIEATCPNSCSLKDKGCYAQLSMVGMHVRRLDQESEGQSAIQVAKAEAYAIDNCYDGDSVPSNRDMRLHVAGDSRTLIGTRIINNAIGRWKERGGGFCWSYTHAWKRIARSNWSNVSILASVETIKEANEARKQGYAPAIVVDEFNGDKAFKLKGSDVKWIPCPAQTREVGCSDCRLCMKADFLYNSNSGIAFAAHGVRKETIKRRLKVIQ